MRDTPAMLRELNVVKQVSSGDALTETTSGAARDDEPMNFDWPRELFNQFDLQWNLTNGPSLEALTDEEYLWEPVPGCWSIRPTGPGGRGEFEAWPDPEPVPVTTIAWRLSHLAVSVFGLRASHYFGDGSLTHENAERPLTAKEGVAYFKQQALLWRSRMDRSRFGGHPA